MVDDGIPGGHLHTADLPEEVAEDNSATQGSLSEDIVALIDDGKTYVEAEIAFQKTRLAFAADRGKSGLLLGISAFAVLHLALIALVVGLIFALSPIITAWGATAIIAGILLIAGLILGLKAKARFERLVDAYKEASE
ncbi:phage holin family protein [Allopontixanthobacter sp.]|uniref:phage holin family protein n=1 Tax=Allopontixanthobacter sp. TaxID=2906452 RepID=UPI002AB93D36|nr:phage holin family protein [Allopontixanthobacter sp.]MDZ4307318.1 phage holin family protein [Allopontixanthobacter sp.]